MSLGCLLFVAGSAIFYMMPAYLTYVGGRLALDPAQLGSLAAIESLAIGVASLSSPLWIDRADRRICIVLGIVACLLGNLATVYVSGFRSVLVCRFLLGLFGEGVLYTVSFTVLGGLRNVDRGFAVALTAAVVFGAAITAVASPLNRLIPPIGLLAPLILIALAIVPLLGKSPPREKAAGIPAAHPRRGRDWMPILALVAQAIWFGAPGAFWTFAEQVATDKGVPAETAELALSVGELAGLLGSILAAWAGDRWGRLRPIAAASIGMSVAAIVYQFCHGPVGLALFLSIFYGFWNWGTVYQMGFVAQLDRDGRSAVMMPAAQVFGLSVGPFCAGQLMQSQGDSAVTLSTVLFAVGGLAIYLVCFSRAARGA
jgi:predicted MFS family arabinose efflux permease